MSVGGATDTTLLLPYRVVAAGDRVYVFDDATQRLLAFDPTGRLKWSFGRKGAGPDEFRNVRDVEIGLGGHIFILDPANVRVTVLDSSGVPLRHVSLANLGSHAEQLVPIDSSRLLLLTMDSEFPFIVIDLDGKVQGKHAMPWAGYSRLHPLARQGQTVLSRTDSTWVFTFSVGNGWYAFRGREPLQYVGQYVEHTRFPELREQLRGNRLVTEIGNVPFSANAAAASDSLLYVLFGGKTKVRNGLVDLYQLGDGRYVGSYLLPRRAKTIAVSKGVIYALFHVPYPKLLALRPRAG